MNKSISSWIIKISCIIFSLIFLYTAMFGVFPGWIQRNLLVMFALFLSFLIYPREKKYTSITDYFLSLMSLITGIYSLLNYERIQNTVGLKPEYYDVIISTIVVILIIIAAYRVVGKPMTFLVAGFLVYSYFGRYLPIPFGHRGFGVSEIVSFQFMSLNGIFL